MKIHLRRFSGEGITLVTMQPSAAFRIASVASADHRLPNESGSVTSPRVLLYEVELIAGCTVQPVDWRRFAYEDNKVYASIAACVQDNLAQFVFLPGTDETGRTIRDCLSAALGDLQSIADVKSVACRFADSRWLIELCYETKNGAIRQVSIEQAVA
jgi:hypothetical protein